MGKEGGRRKMAIFGIFGELARIVSGLSRITHVIKGREKRVSQRFSKFM
jgi:hypothetical protein